MASGLTPRLLVVGGGGFLGHHLVRRACQKGWDVVSLGLSRPVEGRLHHGARYVLADITKPGSLEALAETQFDYVVNSSGYVDHTLLVNGGSRAIRAHFDGLLNLLECIDRRALRRFVQLGSSDEYGSGPAPQNEDCREAPISPYSAAKVAATHLLQMLYRSEGLPAVTLRLFLTYGPGQAENRFLPQIIKGCIKGDSFPVSQGEQIRDFLYVDDTVDAILCALESDSANGQVINIGSGTPITIRSAVELVVKMVGTGKPQFGALPYRSLESMALYADTAVGREVLGWSPKISFESGIVDTVNWVRRGAR